MQDKLYTRLTALGIIMVVISLVVVGCSKNEDDGGGGGSGGGVTQVDRMAVPGVNTALISTPLKNTFNAGDPSTDIANFQSEIQTNMTNLRTAVNGIAGFPAEDSPGLTVAQVTAVVCPDVVSISFASAVAFPNGRQLADDVIDPVLGLVLNRGNPLGGGGGVSDGIANDSTFIITFPYLAAANP